MRNTGPLIRTCLGQLKQAVGFTLPIRLEQPPKSPQNLDLFIGTKPPLHLLVEATARATTKNQALHTILQLKAQAGEAMVFADWIPDPIAEEFRKAGIFFVDAQGNVFIRKPPHVVIDIRGKKPDRPLKAEPGRLIEPGGLKVVHYLLTRPTAAGDPLRTIAQRAGVGLATAHAVIRELQQRQWLLPAAEDKRRFGDLKGLIELFVRGYALKLRPACLLGRYRHQKRVPREILDGFTQRLANMQGHWAVTGGMAAEQLTHYLEPDTVELFVDDQAMATLRAEPLLRDDANGNVTILRLFNPTVLTDKMQAPLPLTTPLLIYAELLEAGGARDIETAKMIYEQFLEPTIARGK
ncbi:MAG: hypothetical protein A3J74_03705 [Elusimicrobia bacterium RIFCSPHIGHO2_02_FULL_57_9]|nr:MAG: hypothetical protein A3J74_03705 [Elusimicrobia bacterium RIFCSPHIGHO2_02_FULL_57_9]